MRIGGSVSNLRRGTGLSIPQAKAAQLGFGLVCNHPFVDGNKRIGAHAMLVFLAVNGIELSYEQQELIDVILSVASGEIDRQGLLQWILDHE
ncbi:MAG: type II toxin-antitoxin system death-on-curing family toxin [Acutalibacteraceae bacterium]